MGRAPSSRALADPRKELAELERKLEGLLRHFPELRRFTGREVVLQYGRAEEKELFRITERIARSKMALSPTTGMQRRPRQVRIKRSASRQPATEFTHSEDFISVAFKGKQYTLTSRQAQVVQILHGLFEQRHAEVGAAYVLEQLGTRGSRLRDTFKRSGLWGRGKLVGPGSKRGTVRLYLSESH